MAVVIVTQPEPSLIMMRSPIMSLLQEIDSVKFNNPTYRFSVKVKVWDGGIVFPPADPIVELLRPPNPTGQGIFNTAPPIEDLFAPAQPFLSGSTSTAGVWNCQLIFGYYLDGVYEEVSEGDVFQIVDGYAVQQQLINEYENYTAITAGEHFLSPLSTMYVITGEKAWISFYLGQNPDRFLDYQDDQGNTFLRNFPTGTVGTSAQSIYRSPIGTVEVAAAAASAGSPWAPQQWFEVRIRELAGLLNTIRVYIYEPHFCDIGSDCLAYVNRYGVWDYLHVRGRITSSGSQQRTTWKRRVLSSDAGLNYPEGISEEGVTGIVGGKSFRVNTGYVPAETKEKIQDVILSKVHYLASINQAVKLETGSIDFQENTQEDLINYTLDFSLAGNLIQDIE